jgi:hypothetical protein
MRQDEPLSTAPAIADGHMIAGGQQGTVYAYLPGTGVVAQPPAPAKQPATKAQSGGRSAEKPRARATSGRAAEQPTPPVTPPATPAVEKPIEPAPATGATAAAPAPANLPTVPGTPSVAAVLPPSGARPAGAGLAPAALAPVVASPAPTPVPTVPTPSVVATKPVAPQKPVAVEKPATPEPVPAAPPPAKTPPATPKPPADFPQPTQPPATLAPATPAAPPAPPTPAAGPLLTLLITPADGRIPTLLCNQNTIFVGGKVAATADVVRVRVNGLETPIRNGEYGTNVTLPGVGSYQIMVEAETRRGERNVHRRRVLVLSGRDARAAELMELGQRGGSFIATFTPGVRNTPLASLRKVVELRNDREQLVRSWSMTADVTEAVNWNGSDAAGKVLPAGRYTATYVLVDAAGAALASVTQPLELRD